MSQRIHDDLNESNEWNDMEEVSFSDADHSSELPCEESLAEPAVDDARNHCADEVFRSGPMLALEQLVEALEERQLSDQRKTVQAIDFADRRKTVRRSSDLNRHPSD